MKNRYLLIFGQFALALGIIGQYLSRNYMVDNSVLHFFAGLFIGLSLVLNLAFLIKNRKKAK